MSDLIFAKTKNKLFDSDEGISGLFNESLTPEYCVKIGTAAGLASSDFKHDRTGRVGVMYSRANKNDKTNFKNNISKLIRNSLLCGIVASGAKSYDFGEGFDSLAAFAAGNFRLDCLLYADRIEEIDNSTGELTGEMRDVIKIFDYNALTPSRAFERKFDSALTKDDYQPPLAEELYETEIFEGLNFLYFSELLKTGAKLNGMKVCVNSVEVNKTGSPAHILKKALIELGADVLDCEKYEMRNLIGVLILEPEPDGFFVSARYNNINADFWHVCAIIIKDMIKRGESEIAMPYLAPHAIQRVADQMGASMLRYISCAFEESESGEHAKSKIMPQFYLKDGCFAAVKLCAILYNSRKNLDEHLKDLPEFFSKNLDINAEDSHKTHIISMLNSQIIGNSESIKNACTCSICNVDGNANLREKEGIKLDYENGFVSVIPKRGAGFRLIAEAASSEAADEILDLTGGKIREIIEAMNGDMNV